MPMQYELAWPYSPGIAESLLEAHASDPIDTLPISVFTKN
jgi:hypothetical protein